MSQPQQPPQMLPHVDVSDVREIFVDFVRQHQCTGPIVKLEFVVTRLDEVKPPAAQTGKTYTAARLVMPLDGFLQWHAQATALIANLEAAGTIKRNPVEQAPQAKH